MSKLFILDYDDTLFPTSCYENIKSFRKIRNQIRKLFFTLKKFGKVIVITNASLGWVKQTSHEYLSLNLIDLIPVYSMRDLKPDLPLDFSEKKIFLEKYLSENKFDEIIGFGDLFNDRNYIISFSKSHFVKNIKFIKRPSYLQLVQSLKLINQVILEVIYYNDTLDLKIELNMKLI